MKIEGNIRVVKSEHGCEVYVQSSDPVANFVLYCPPDSKVKDGDSIEFVQDKDAVPVPETAAAALPAVEPAKKKAAK